MAQVTLIQEIFILLVVFQITHFVADFPLQNAYMLKKMQLKGWVLPLIAHVAVHGLFTLFILFAVRPEMWWLALVDAGVHFVVDRLKASPNFFNRWGPQEPQFWWALGIDQMLHHLTHYAIIYIVVMT